MTVRAKISAAGVLGLALLALPATAPDANAREDRFPYSIMTPEPGTVSHRQVKSVKPARHAKTSRGRVKLLARRPTGRTARGSSGSVPPLALPRTPQIPPITTRIPSAIAAPRDPGLTFVPGQRPTPNLPHGIESFQDRASRCAHQAGINVAPGGDRNAYLGACM